MFQIWLDLVCSTNFTWHAFHNWNPAKMQNTYKAVKKVNDTIVNIMGGFGRLGHVSKYVVFSLTSQL